MAHGLESGASVTHRRGVFGDPEQLVAFNAVLPSQHEHRDRCGPPFNPFAVDAHQLSVPMGCPSVVDGGIPAAPVVLKCSLAVLHTEVIPTDLLGQQRIQPLLEQPTVLHQFRCFISTIRREQAMQLRKRSSIQLKPAAFAQ